MRIGRNLWLFVKNLIAAGKAQPRCEGNSMAGQVSKLLAGKVSQVKILFSRTLTPLEYGQSYINVDVEGQPQINTELISKVLKPKKTIEFFIADSLNQEQLSQDKDLAREVSESLGLIGRAKSLLYLKMTKF